MGFCGLDAVRLKVAVRQLSRTTLSQRRFLRIQHRSYVSISLIRHFERSSPRCFAVNNNSTNRSNLFSQQRHSFASRAVEPPTTATTEYYDVLGIHKSATQAQIKAAYYAKSKVLHPDVNNSGEAEHLFIQVTQAYQVLGDVDLRMRYDKGLAVTDIFRHKPGSAHSGTMRNARREGPLDYSTKYNFDEFYKKHYQEARKYEQVRKHHQEQVRQAVADQRSHSRVVNIMFVLLACGMFLVR